MVNAGAGADAECSGVLRSLVRRAGDNAIVMPHWLIELPSDVQ